MVPGSMDIQWPELESASCTKDLGDPRGSKAEDGLSYMRMGSLTRHAALQGLLSSL